MEPKRISAPLDQKTIDSLHAGDRTQSLLRNAGVSRLSLNMHDEVDAPRFPKERRRSVPIWMMPNLGLASSASRIACEHA